VPVWFLQIPRSILGGIPSDNLSKELRKVRYGRIGGFVGLIASAGMLLISACCDVTKVRYGFLIVNV